MVVAKHRVVPTPAVGPRVGHGAAAERRGVRLDLQRTERRAEGSGVDEVEAEDG
jgi:hypothetical protein